MRAESPRRIIVVFIQDHQDSFRFLVRTIILMLTFLFMSISMSMCYPCPHGTGSRNTPDDGQYYGLSVLTFILYYIVYYSGDPAGGARHVNRPHGAARREPRSIFMAWHSHLHGMAC